MKEQEVRELTESRGMRHQPVVACLTVNSVTDTSIGIETLKDGGVTPAWSTLYTHSAASIRANRRDSAGVISRIDAHAGHPCRALRARLALVAAALFISSSASACWEDAAGRYGVNAYLLYAIAKTESNLNPSAINRNKNGSYDIGLMQINSLWLPTLRKYGIEEAQLWDACINIHVGAWVLAQNMHRLGNSWEAVGAYNSSKPAYRLRYAQKVFNNLPRSLVPARVD